MLVAGWQIIPNSHPTFGNTELHQPLLPRPFADLKKILSFLLRYENKNNFY
jgi:hypothetical protein